MVIYSMLLCIKNDTIYGWSSISCLGRCIRFIKNNIKLAVWNGIGLKIQFDKSPHSLTLCSVYVRTTANITAHNSQEWMTACMHAMSLLITVSTQVGSFDKSGRLLPPEPALLWWIHLAIYIEQTCDSKSLSRDDSTLEEHIFGKKETPENVSHFLHLWTGLATT